MNTSKDTDSNRFDDDRREALQLVCRQIDGDLATGDVLRLEELERQFSSEMAQFRSQCLALQQGLKSLPQRPVSGVLFDSRSASLADPPLPSSVRHRRFSFAMAAFVTVVCSCLLVMFLKPDESHDSGRPVLATNDVDGSRPQTMSAKLEVADLPEIDLQPLLTSEDWNVVVVRVDEKDREEAMQQIESIARSHGLQLDDSRGNDKADWLGVILTSAVADRDDIVNDMEQGLGAVSESSDGQLIGNVASRDIVNAVRKSFESPTQSELHHGKIYLALPASDSSPHQSAPVPNQNLVADAKVPLQRKVATAKASEPPLEAAANLSEMPAAAVAKDSVTLVVFEFVSDGHGSNQKI